MLVAWPSLAWLTVEWDKEADQENAGEEDQGHACDVDRDISLEWVEQCSCMGFPKDLDLVMMVLAILQIC